jgi:hypothetical protein
MWHRGSPTRTLRRTLRWANGALRWTLLDTSGACVAPSVLAPHLPVDTQDGVQRALDHLNVTLFT